MDKKTPRELAEEHVNKKIAKMIATRQLEIKRLQAKIKMLEKEITKIESGELVPRDDVLEDDDKSSSGSFIRAQSSIQSPLSSVYRKV